ncbi:hypothetical protein B0J14DRAFT_561855 [Halenospora varia]|nr:hypothetical protein B0J14DRAFT_561855 [Halenospora varia]
MEISSWDLKLFTRRAIEIATKATTIAIEVPPSLRFTIEIHRRITTEHARATARHPVSDSLGFNIRGALKNTAQLPHATSHPSKSIILWQQSTVAHHNCAEFFLCEKHLPAAFVLTYIPVDIPLRQLSCADSENPGTVFETLDEDPDPIIWAWELDSRDSDRVGGFREEFTSLQEPANIHWTAGHKRTAANPSAEILDRRDTERIQLRPLERRDTYLISQTEDFICHPVITKNRLLSTLKTPIYTFQIAPYTVECQTQPSISPTWSSTDIGVDEPPDFSLVTILVASLFSRLQQQAAFEVTEALLKKEEQSLGDTGRIVEGKGVFRTGCAKFGLATSSRENVDSSFRTHAKRPTAPFNSKHRCSVSVQFAVDVSHRIRDIKSSTLRPVLLAVAVPYPVGPGLPSTEMAHRQSGGYKEEPGVAVAGDHPNSQASLFLYKVAGIVRVVGLWEECGFDAFWKITGTASGLDRPWGEFGGRVSQWTGLDVPAKFPHRSFVVAIAAGEYVAHTCRISRPAFARPPRAQGVDCAFISFMSVYRRALEFAALHLNTQRTRRSGDERAARSLQPGLLEVEAETKDRASGVFLATAASKRWPGRLECRSLTSRRALCSVVWLAKHRRKNDSAQVQHTSAPRRPSCLLAI